jgi:hypothetical protein
MRLRDTVAVSVAGGFAGDVALAAAGLPAGTMAVFSPNNLAQSKTLIESGSASG